jgi:hypothetical protein
MIRAEIEQPQTANAMPLSSQADANDVDDKSSSNSDTGTNDVDDTAAFGDLDLKRSVQHSSRILDEMNLSAVEKENVLIKFFDDTLKRKKHSVKIKTGTSGQKGEGEEEEEPCEPMSKEKALKKARAAGWTPPKEVSKASEAPEAPTDEGGSKSAASPKPVAPKQTPEAPPEDLETTTESPESPDATGSAASPQPVAPKQIPQAHQGEDPPETTTESPLPDDTGSPAHPLPKNYGIAKLPVGVQRVPLSASLKCVSIHDRQDHHPHLFMKFGRNNVVEDTDTQLFSGGYTNFDGVEKIHSVLDGHNMWKRYPVSSDGIVDGPSYSPIKSVAVMWAVITGISEQKTEIFIENERYPLSLMQRKAEIEEVKALVKRCTVDELKTLSHDVFSPAPFTEKHNGVKDKTFLAGMGTTWLTYGDCKNASVGRTKLLFALAGGASLGGVPMSNWVVPTAGHEYLYDMGINFTTYSSANNKMALKFSVDYMTGMPSGEMNIYHYQEFKATRPADTANSHYFYMLFSCNNADEEYKAKWYKSGTDKDGKDIAAKQEKQWIQLKLLQLYDICHCYYSHPADVKKCTMIESVIKDIKDPRSKGYGKMYAGHGKLWYDLMSRVYNVIHKDLAKLRGVDSAEWKQIPTVEYKDGTSKQCWTTFSEQRNRTMLSKIAGSMLSPFSAQVAMMYDKYQKPMMKAMQGLAPLFSGGGGFGGGLDKKLHGLGKMLGPLAIGNKNVDGTGRLVEDEEHRHRQQMTHDLDHDLLDMGYISELPDDHIELPSLHRRSPVPAVDAGLDDMLMDDPMMPG